MVKAFVSKFNLPDNVNVDTIIDMEFYVNNVVPYVKDVIENIILNDEEFLNIHHSFAKTYNNRGICHIPVLDLIKYAPKYANLWTQLQYVAVKAMDVSDIRNENSILETMVFLGLNDTSVGLKDHADAVEVIGINVLNETSWIFSGINESFETNIDKNEMIVRQGQGIYMPKGVRHVVVPRNGGYRISLGLVLENIN